MNETATSRLHKKVKTARRIAGVKLSERMNPKRITNRSGKFKIIGISSRTGMPIWIRK